MTATVTIREKNTAGQTPTDKTGAEIRFKLADDANVDLGSPMVVPTSGTAYSYEKWLRINVSGTFGEIDNLRFYADGASGYGTGVKLWALRQGTYATPAIPSTANDPPQRGGTPFVDLFSYTSAAPLALDVTNSGPYNATGVPKDIGDYLVLVAEIEPGATQGVRSGEVLSFSWDETGAVEETNIYTLDTDGFVVHDGTRIFPIGLYMTQAYQASLNQISGHMNTGLYVDYGGTSSSPSYADACNALGMKCFLTMAEENFRDLPSGTKTTNMAAYFSAIGTRKNIIGYFNFDEPARDTRDLGILSVAESEDFYNRVHAAFPSGTIVPLTDYVVTSAQDYYDAYDVFNYDMYPIGTSYGGTLEQGRTVFRNLQAVVSAAPAYKPMWLTFQCFFTTDNRWVQPTQTELRFMAYMGITNKARAIIGYSWHFDTFTMSSETAFQADVNAVFDELMAHSYIFVMSDSTTVSASAGAVEIDILAKGNSSVAYLICANYSSGTWNGQRAPGVAHNSTVITVTGFSSGTYQPLLPTPGSQTAFSGGTFTVNFAAYEAQIYKLLP